jgi:hypothetical protein
MPNAVYSGNNTSTSLSNQYAKILPELWKKGADIAERMANFWEEFEGTDMNSPILYDQDLNKGAGMTLNFSTFAGLYGKGGIGDQAIGDKAEQWRVGGYQLKLDYFRHNTEYTERTIDMLGKVNLGGEIQERIPEALGEWMGAKKTEQMDMMFIHRGNPENTIYANNKAGREALRSADTISLSMIQTTAQVLKTAGARPARVGTIGRNKVHKFIFVALDEALNALKNSSDYKAALNSAGERGDANYIFSGGYAPLDGQIIRERSCPDHEGYGPIGCPLAPKALLGNAIAAGTGAFDITGGGSPSAAAVQNTLYFRDFSNYAYEFGQGDVVSVGSDDRYVIIYNISGPDAHKWGFYRYVNNDGTKLTVTQRLGASAGGIRATTVGNVTWNAAVNTDVHPAGSIIIETNSRGVAFARSIMLGGAAALRGHGRFRNRRTEDVFEGGHIKQVFITSIFGQAVRKRSDGRVPGYRVVEHAITYAGLNLPVVT